jgi:hypothetical protein
MLVSRRRRGPKCHPVSVHEDSTPAATSPTDSYLGSNIVSTGFFSAPIILPRTKDKSRNRKDMDRGVVLGTNGDATMKGVEYYVVGNIQNAWSTSGKTS